jgi:hypothetical protein
MMAGISKAGWAEAGDDAGIAAAAIAIADVTATIVFFMTNSPHELPRPASRWSLLDEASVCEF